MRRRVFCGVSELFVKVLGFVVAWNVLKLIELLLGFLIHSAAIMFQSVCVCCFSGPNCL